MPPAHERIRARTDGVGETPFLPYARPVRHDDDLIAAARRGEHEAFGELVRRHERRLRPVIARLLSDPRDTDEALQDTFVAAWRGLDGFRGRASFGTWIHRIAVNEALMRLRRRRPERPDLDPLIPDPGPGPAELAESADLQRRLDRWLRSLPDEHRLPLVLRDIAGMSNREAAAALGISLAAMKSRVHRARLLLLEEVADWEERGGGPVSPPPET